MFYERLKQLCEERGVALTQEPIKPKGYTCSQVSYSAVTAVIA